MDWRAQKWASIGYWLGVIATIVWRDTTGVMIGWAVTAIVTVIGA